MLFAIDSEFICIGFAHGTKDGNILADAVTHAIESSLKLIVLLGAVDQLEEIGSALQDGGEHTAHGGNGSDRPDPIEDKPHDHEHKRYPDETVASRSQLRWRAEASKRYQVERECNLKCDVIEPRPTGDPR